MTRRGKKNKKNGQKAKKTETTEKTGNQEKGNKRLCALEKSTKTTGL